MVLNISYFNKIIKTYVAMIVTKRFNYLYIQISPMSINTIKIQSIMILSITAFAISIILSPFPHINAQPFNLATPIVGTANIVIITAANENNDIIKNCLTVNPSDQDECTNTGSSIFFTINPPSNTVTLQCTLNIDFNNNTANQPFACTSSLQITNPIQNSGALSLQVQAFDDSNELISQNVFQWLQGISEAKNIDGDPNIGGAQDLNREQYKDVVDVSLQCKLRLDEQNPITFICRPTLFLTGIAESSGDVILEAQASDSNGTLIGKSIFKWSEGISNFISGFPESRIATWSTDVSFSCKLIFGSENNPVNKSFICLPNVDLTGIAANNGDVILEAQASDSNGTLIGKSIFKWSIGTEDFISGSSSNLSLPSTQITNSSEWNQEGEGIFTKGLVVFNNSTFPIYFKESDGRKVIEGDIVLKDVKPKTPEEAALNYATFGNPWKNGEVPYYFDSALGSSERNKIEQAMFHINGKTGIKFQLTSPNPPKDSIVFTNPGNTQAQKGICQSYVGKVGGPQPLWFGQNCGVGNAIHEILHALGVYHEMSRNDRDNYIRINSNNLPSELAQNYEMKLCNGTINCAVPNGQYDYCSIMQYGRYHPGAINPNIPVIETLKPTNCEIGQRQGLSQGDIAGINFLY